MPPRAAAIVPICLGLAFAWGHGALAMVGGATPAADGAGRSAVLIVGSHGTSCSGVALRRDLVLTAGHCVLPGSDYKLVEFGAAHHPTLQDVARIAHHPEFDVGAVLRHRTTADVALLKAAMQLGTTPARLAPAESAVVVGDAFVVAGFGVAVRGDGRSGGTVRAATLVATGQPGSLQIRLVDPATKGERAGLGACTGDSGAPVFRDIGGALAVIGLVSWSTGAGNTEGCGGLTGVTPLARYRAWIADTAARMGAPLAN
jgi:Trypsin